MRWLGAICAWLLACSSRANDGDALAGAGGAVQAGATQMAAGSSASAGASGVGHAQTGNGNGNGGSGGTAVAHDAGAAVVADGGHAVRTDAGASTGEACPGAAAPEYDSLARCTQGGCPLGEVCGLVPPGVVGGISPPPPPSCPAPCAANQVCVVSAASASCQPICTRDADCMGFRCAPGEPGASVTGCAPQLCKTAADCSGGVLWTCDLRDPERNGNGCTRLLCTTDADCPCGSCDGGRCWERARRCFKQLFAP